MDRTYQAWMRELDPTPRAKRAKRRGFIFAALCALTLGYLLAVGGWWAIVFLLAIAVLVKGMK